MLCKVSRRTRDSQQDCLSLTGRGGWSELSHQNPGLTPVCGSVQATKVTVRRR